MTQEFLNQHPFVFNLLRRLDSGKLTHVNSLYKDYNCSPSDLIERDTNFRKKIICKTQEEITAALASPPLEGRQQLYILTPLRTKEIAEMNKESE